MDTAREMQKKFIEVLIAPEYDRDALNLLKKKKNMRILKCSMEKDPEKAIPLYQAEFLCSQGWITGTES